MRKDKDAEPEGPCALPFYSTGNLLLPALAPYLNGHLPPIYTLRQSPRSPPKAMASPQTIPQVVEVDEARAPPSFGPRSRSIMLLLSAACLAAQS